MVTIARAWIEDGCIGCGRCPSTCPDVFIISEADAMIRGEARVDGITSPNRDERALLNSVCMVHADAIEEAASGCPVDVIRFSSAPDG